MVESGCGYKGVIGMVERSVSFLYSFEQYHIEEVSINPVPSMIIAFNPSNVIHTRN